MDNADVREVQKLADDLCSFIADRGIKEGFHPALGEVALYMAAVQLSFALAGADETRQHVEEGIRVMLNELLASVVVQH